MSTVSVVIPCYKYGRYLDEAVASVTDAQQGVDVRVLIIDDASPDDSAVVAQKLADRDPRVEVRVHSVNQGHIATYNEGLIEWADGDYCVLMSADDRLTPGALRRARDFLDANPNAGFVHGNALRFTDGTPLPPARAEPGGDSVVAGHWWFAQWFREIHNLVHTHTVVVRTALQKEVGGYDPRLPHAGDMELWMRLAAHADVGYLRGVDQAYTRIHGRNMWMSFNPLQDLAQRKLVYETILDRYGYLLPDKDRASDLVHRKLSQEALWIAARAYDRGRTARTPVEDLEDFALNCWPRARELPQYSTLQLRKRVGPRLMPYLQPVVLSAVVHEARIRYRRESWKRRGF